MLDIINTLISIASNTDYFTPEQLERLRAIQHAQEWELRQALKGYIAIGVASLLGVGVFGFVAKFFWGAAKEMYHTAESAWKLVKTGASMGAGAAIGGVGGAAAAAKAGAGIEATVKAGALGAARGAYKGGRAMSFDWLEKKHEEHMMEILSKPKESTPPPPPEPPIEAVTQSGSKITSMKDVVSKSLPRHEQFREIKINDLSKLSPEQFSMAMGNLKPYGRLTVKNDVWEKRWDPDTSAMKFYPVNKETGEVNQEKAFSFSEMINTYYQSPSGSGEARSSSSGQSQGGSTP